MDQRRAETSPAIGIDLGTWKCCVGVVREGKVEIIENERSKKTTPSYVAFTETERLVGEDARIQAGVNPTNTVFGVKRIIGRSSHDPSLQSDVNTIFPFTVQFEKEKPLFEVNYRGETRKLFPEQVSAMLLAKMKRITEFHLGCKVQDAVISVPAYFNNAQRQATKDAGAIAGLNVLGLINEPTAAALAYRDNKGPMEETIIVVDLGGGTLDVSVIELRRDGSVQVKKISGNTSFGGIDFEMCMVKHFQTAFAMKAGQNISGNKKALLRLQLACEKLKHTLTLLRSGDIELNSLANDTDFVSSLTKEEFNSISADLLHQRLYTVVHNLLHVSEPQVQMQTISKIVLIGGSTRVPSVQQYLERLFKVKKFDHSLNPDEAIAYGAAIYASELSSGHSNVMDVCAHAIALTNEANVEFPLIAANTSISRLEYLPLDQQEMANQRMFLTEIQVLVNPSRSVQTTDIGVIKGIGNDLTKYGLASGFDKDGLFVADLMEKCDEKLLYGGESYEKMKKVEEQFEKDDKKEKERSKALNFVESYCAKHKAKARQLRNEPQLKDACEAFMRDCDSAMRWLEDNPGATKAECREKLQRLHMKIKILSDLVSKENYPADTLRYEAHPYLLGESSSDESSSEIKDRKLERKSKKGKKKFHSAPSMRNKRRPSLSAMESVEYPSKAPDSDDSFENKFTSDEPAWKGKKPKRTSSSARRKEKFFSAPTSKKKQRQSVKGHFTQYDDAENSSEGDGSNTQNTPAHNKKKKSGCSLM